MNMDKEAGEKFLDLRLIIWLEGFIYYLIRLLIKFKPGGWVQMRLSFERRSEQTSVFQVFQKYGLSFKNWP